LLPIRLQEKLKSAISNQNFTSLTKLWIC